MKQEPESAVSWFKQNQMIVDADKFKAIVLNKNESEAEYKLTIDNRSNKIPLISCKRPQSTDTTINERAGRVF